MKRQSVKASRIVGVVSATLALGCASCASLPTSSAPAPFDVNSHEGTSVQLSADGPVDGSDAVTLVSDFLLACAAGGQDDFTTARLFLTSASANVWRPQTQILIYDTDTTPTISASSENASSVEVTISLTGVASLDETGILTRSLPLPVTQTLTLVREGGQWRIEVPDDVALMSRASFTATYSLSQLYFPASTGDELIADPRWYPSRRLATHLVDGLISGPRPSLSASVTNALPAGTTLPSRGVDVSDGVAHVELNATLPPSESARSLLEWELTRTLSGVADIARVEATLSGERLEASLPSSPRYMLDTLVGMEGVNLSTLAATSNTPTGISVGERAYAPTVSPVDSSLFAWGDEAGLEAAHTSGARVRIPIPTPLGPSLDRFGWMWGASADPSTLSVVTVGAEVTSVPIEPAGGESVRGVRISPDGARILLLRGDSGLWVGTVERDTEGAPVAVHSLESLSTPRGMIIDVSWTSSQGVALALRGSGESGDQLVTFPLGGFYSSVSLPLTVRSLSAGSSAGIVVIEGEDSAGRTQVLIRSGALWQSASEGVRDARYAG